MEPRITPTQSGWAALREALRLTLSNTKNTGMAINKVIAWSNEVKNPVAVRLPASPFTTE